MLLLRIWRDWRQSLLRGLMRHCMGGARVFIPIHEYLRVDRKERSCNECKNDWLPVRDLRRKEGQEDSRQEILGALI